MIVLVTGGARSGKSSFAEAYASRLGAEGIYVATAQPFDDEMKQRIALHRADREGAAFRWHTVEQPFGVAELLHQINTESNIYRAEKRVILIDCMTLWLSNWLLRYENEPEADRLIAAKIDELCRSLAAFQGTVVLVTNEVGYGLVPEYPLGRTFRDASGRMNQKLASLSKYVFLVTSGIPVELKALAFRFGR